MNIYTYNARNLWLAYGFTIFATLYCIAASIRASQLNGVSHDSSFSGIMSTTRNPTLDTLTGQSFRSEPLSKELDRKRLMLGVLNERDDVDHESTSRLGFGVPGEVYPLKTGGVSLITAVNSFHGLGIKYSSILVLPRFEEVQCSMLALPFSSSFTSSC
jgi:hypothetical protein